jgi:O-acetyl-ADP-ribose deacetylase (regulator of RNase III)
VTVPPESFDVAIRRVRSTRDQNAYQATLRASTGDVASWEFTLPPGDNITRFFFSRSPREQRATGHELFTTVLPADVRAWLLRLVAEKRVGLRLALHVARAPELADLPWEYLYDRDSRQFLVFAGRMTVVRVIDDTKRVQPLTLAAPLRVLAAIADPSGRLELDVDQEWTAMAHSLADLAKAGLVAVDRLEPVTLEALRARLAVAEYHVFHFIGHDTDPFDGTGALTMASEDGAREGRLVEALTLDKTLGVSRFPRLVILNTSEASRDSAALPLSQTAHALIRSGISAVLASPPRFNEVGASDFYRQFYAGLVDNQPVDVAVARGYTKIFSSLDEPGWGAPRLYTCSLDDGLFNVVRSSTARRRPERKHAGVATDAESADAESRAVARVSVAMEHLTAAERDVMARTIPAFIAGSGTRANRTLQALSETAGVPRRKLGTLLKELSGPRGVLRQTKRGREHLYEISHDSLVPALREWQVQHDAAKAHVGSLPFRSAHALVIGISAYPGRSLPNAANDARAVFDLLVDPDFGGYPRENVTLLLDQAATGKRVRRAFQDLAARTSPDSTLFIYFSGQGSRVGDGSSVDGLALLADGGTPEALSGSQINQALDVIPTRHVLVVADCSYGGVGIRGGSGRVILSAAEPGEHAYDKPEYIHGVFTRHLLEALRGGAATSDDGLIRVFDVYEYVHEHVTRETDIGRQRPTLGADPSDNFPIVPYPRTKQAQSQLNAEGFRYDVFISHATDRSDVRWMSEELVPPLVGAGLQVALVSNVEAVGTHAVATLDRGVAHSKRTLVVVTPAHLKKGLSKAQSIIEAKLSGDRRKRLAMVRAKQLGADAIPAWLRPPTAQQFDFSNPRRVERGIGKLIDALRAPLQERGEKRFDYSCCILYASRRGESVNTFVDALHEALSAEMELLGLPPVYLESSQPLATDFGAITWRRALLKSACAIWVYTPDYVQSTYDAYALRLMQRIEETRLSAMRSDTSHAERGLILPLILRRGDQLPDELRRRQAVDFSRWLSSWSQQQSRRFMRERAGLIRQIVDYVGASHRLLEAAPEPASELMDSIARPVVSKETLSPSARGALDWAEGLRQLLNVPVVECEHILAGLYQKRGSTAHKLLTIFESDEEVRANLQRLVSRDLVQFERVEPAPSDALAILPLSAGAEQALRNATAHAHTQNLDATRMRHLLVGLLSTDNRASRWVADTLQVERGALYAGAVDLTHTGSFSGLQHNVRSRSQRSSAQKPTASPSRLPIKFVMGDLLELHVDAIVNPVGRMVTESGYVGLDLGKRLGKEYRQALTKLPPLAEGEAVSMQDDRLRARHVIHTRTTDEVGANSVERIERGVIAALELATHLSGVKSVGFPAIGSGAAGLSAGDIAPAVLRAVVSHVQQGGGPREVIFAFRDADAHRAYDAAYERLLASESEIVPTTRWHLTLDADMKGVLAVGEAFTLTLLASAVERPDSVPLRLPASALEVTVYIEAPGFYLHGDQPLPLPVVDGAPSQTPITLRFVPLASGTHAVRVVAYPGGRVQGVSPAELTYTLTVASPVALPDIPELIDRRKIPNPQPDMMFYVALEDGPTGQQVRLHITCAALGLDRKRMEPALPLNGGDLAALRRAVAHAALETTGASPPDCLTSLRACGAAVFDRLFPAGHEARKTLWDILEAAPANGEPWTCLIVSDERALAPWEFVCPYAYRPDTLEPWFEDFLGRRFNLGQWVGGQGLALAAKAPLARINLAHYGQEPNELARWQAALGGGELAGVEDQPLQVSLTQPGSPYYGLHLLRYVEGTLGGRITYGGEPGSEGNATMSAQAVVYQQRLDLTQRRPIAGLSVIDARPPNLPAELPDADAELEAAWVLPFMHAGVTAVVGPRWPVALEADQLFFRTFYEAVRSGEALGLAVWRAREQVRLALPHRPDWLAYTYFGHPDCAPYPVRVARGFTVFEPIDHLGDAPLAAGQQYRFRASYRAEAPAWFGGRLHIHQAPLAGEELSVAVLPLTGDPPITRTLERVPGSDDYQSIVTLTAPASAPSLPVLVQFAQGGRELQTLMLHLDVAQPQSR